MAEAGTEPDAGPRAGLVGRARAQAAALPAQAQAAAAAALAILLVTALLAPGALASGWLTAWLFAISITTGAAVWFLIWTLTGGRWLAAGRARLTILARATPLAAAPAAIVLLLGPFLYPWWGGGDDLRSAIYLNPISFGLRAVVILFLWAAIGRLAPRGLNAVPAALLLIAYGIVVNFAGLDWMLSRDPDFLSTTFGGFFAIFQLGLALSAAALWGLSREDGRAVADWGGLMLATILGVFYLAAMQFLVSWSGNLPFKAAWYLARQDGAGSWIMGLIVTLGVVVPFFILVVTRRRGDAWTLRRVGALALLAGYLKFAWLAASEHMVAAALAGAAFLTLAAIGALAWRGGYGDG